MVDRPAVTDVALIAPDAGPIPRDLVKMIAHDIGKEVASHIEVMYPAAVAATSSTFLVSVRNCVYNEIMAALDTTDEAEILRRLDERKVFRRQHRARYRKLRRLHVTDAVRRDD